MGLEREALEFIAYLKKLYFEKRDMDALLACMDDRVTWIGTGRGEVSCGLEEAQAALMREKSEYSGAFRVEDYRPVALPLSADTCVVFGSLRALPTEEGVEEQDLRFSTVCERMPEGPRLLHCHFSRPDSVQEAGRYYVHGALRADNASLRSELEERERQLRSLTQNIPGGAHQCKNDPNFTLMSMSDGFLTMFGYTAEDIRTRFEGKFVNMVYPADRAEMLKNAHVQLEKGPTLDLEYRVLCADGRAMWILDKGRLLNAGTKDECFYCILIDITQRKQEQEELRLSLERHQVIMDQATDIIFEWDIRADTLSFSPNWQKKFGYEAISSTISTSIPLSKNIHPEDTAAFVRIMRDTAAGAPYSETEFRIKDAAGQYYWCRIRATAQYDAEHRPIKAVGVILDIDEEKKQKQALLDQAQRDPLTGLYNKAAANALVEQRMHMPASLGEQALMIIDVDDFKRVNDTYGHLAGDSVLSDVAAALKENIRCTDLVGRIGGDEFLVYLPEVTGAEAAMAKAQNILEHLQTIVPMEGVPNITCSVGVVVYPRGTVDFLHLCQYADQALYHRKHNGRKGISLYDKALCGPDPCGGGTTALGTAIGSDESTVHDEYLAQYVFRTLYTSTDVARDLNRLLEIVGRAYDVSRVYIFESSLDGLRSSMTFEWCAPGVTAQLHQLQDYSYEDDLGDYQRNFDSEGMFYCHDINDVSPELRAVLAPQGIHSMLQCAIWEDGLFAGGIGFDECRENRFLGREQVASFKLTASVLATFLRTLRLKERLKKLAGE